MSVIIEAFVKFRDENSNCSVDRMVCDPHLRVKFLEDVRHLGVRKDEFDILWFLMSKRKRKELKKPR